jgi:hypothetical protein
MFGKYQIMLMNYLSVMHLRGWGGCFLLYCNRFCFAIIPGGMPGILYKVHLAQDGIYVSGNILWIIVHDK